MHHGKGMFCDVIESIYRMQSRFKKTRVFFKKKPNPAGFFGF